MTGPVYFPDAEALYIGHLATELAALGYTGNVYDRVPDADQGRPATFVLVRRTGGTRRSKVSDAAQLTIEAWAPTSSEAHDLAQAARALVHDTRGTTLDGTAVYGVAELAGPGNLPDPDSRSPRYTFTVLAHLRGSTSSS